VLKLLKIKVRGYKLLEDDFEIDFTSKARVFDEDLEKEIYEIEEGLYSFRTIALVGGNASGKSTVLSLILKTIQLLQTGRWHYVPRDFKRDKIELEVVFYLDSELYLYKSTLGKSSDLNMQNQMITYSPILKEKLIAAKYNKLKGKKNIDILYLPNNKENHALTESLGDTSAIIKLTRNSIYVDDYNSNTVTNFDTSLVRNTFIDSLSKCEKELLYSIIQLFDNSIEHIIYVNDDNVLFKRINEQERKMSYIELIGILSAGTKRGIELYIRAINALKNGSVFIVDEIENSFQKNLVYNLLLLFNNSEINKKNAQLIFSTHYVEILDMLKRRDGIFITHKNGTTIDAKNLYADYNVRTELSKSKQFDNNVFDTIVNYQQLMKVRRILSNDICANND